MQSVPITTEVASSIHSRGDVKVCRVDMVFARLFDFNETGRHDKTYNQNVISNKNSVLIRRFWKMSTKLVLKSYPPLPNVEINVIVLIKVLHGNGEGM